jgi:hypothetical protein
MGEFPARYSITSSARSSNVSGEPGQIAFGSCSVLQHAIGEGVIPGREHDRNGVGLLLSRSSPGSVGGDDHLGCKGDQFHRVGPHTIGIAASKAQIDP